MVSFSLMVIFSVLALRIVFSLLPAPYVFAPVSSRDKSAGYKMPFESLRRSATRRFPPFVREGMSQDSQVRTQWLTNADSYRRRFGCNSCGLGSKLRGAPNMTPDNRGIDLGPAMATIGSTIPEGREWPS
jgi:hypothetical protein